jgi:hypothetical protein
MCPICSGVSLENIAPLYRGARSGEPHVPLHFPVKRQRKTSKGFGKARSAALFSAAIAGSHARFLDLAGDTEFYELAYGAPSYPRHRWEYDRAIEFPASLGMGAGVG